MLLYISPNCCSTETRFFSRSFAAVRHSIFGFFAWDGIICFEYKLHIKFVIKYAKQYCVQWFVCSHSGRNVQTQTHTHRIKKNDQQQTSFICWCSFLLLPFVWWNDLNQKSTVEGNLYLNLIGHLNVSSTDCVCVCFFHSYWWILSLNRRLFWPH